MTTRSRTKTEHAGAKNGGGYWGKREDAKRVSNKKRREDGKSEVGEQVQIEGIPFDSFFVVSEKIANDYSAIITALGHELKRQEDKRSKAIAKKTKRDARKVVK
jgi:hypothetical protein